VDIDFEGHSLSLNTGDTDFKNPTTPVIVNLITAIRSLKARYGANFVLTMAPETFFVQLGYRFYGSGPFGGQDARAGSYLPVIHALRDILTVLHVQDYNSGSIIGMDDQPHNMGDAAFHIAMTDMLLAGFPVAGYGKPDSVPKNVFPALREDQVAFGAPAATIAGNGYVSPAVIQQAVNCIVRNTNCGNYLMKSGTNPNFRGLMTWSINWDKYFGWEFRTNHGPFLKALP
jgi:chitinase